MPADLNHPCSEIIGTEFGISITEQVFLNFLAMKKYFYTPVLVLLLASLTSLKAQDQQEYLGLPGDNLNLFAVMSLFQESETLEGFERELNNSDNHINNLDLNGDGYVDYIRVADNVDRNVHFIVLQVSVNPREMQDVAVFTVIKRADGDVQVQLIGDEALYGKDYIVEPIYDETPNPGYTGQRVNGNRVTVVHTTSYEVAYWPVVRFMFAPTYIVWHSPWHWDYYPNYWRPWNPFYWHTYYGFHYNYYSWYYGHYRHWNHYRYDGWHDTYYTHYHSHSPYVYNNIHQGYYKTTYSRPESRREGTDLYYRTRESNNRTGVSSSGGRRTSSGSDAPVYVKSKSTDNNYNGRRTSTGSGSRENHSTSSGTRTTGNTRTRESGGSTGTMKSTETTNGRRGTSGGSSSTSTSTSTGNSRQSGTTTRQSSQSGSSRQSGNTTTTTGRQSGSSSNREMTRSKNTESRSTSTERSSGSDRRSGGTSVNTQKSTSGSSGQASRSSERSGSPSGRRSSGSSSTSKSDNNTKSSEKNARSTGRR